MTPPPAAKTSPLVQEAQAPAVQTQAAPIVLAKNHPERYVVVKGDTLWDISGRFLRDPWRWPEVWQGNPQVANPHLIYPGDVLVLMMVGGKPVIRHEGAGTAGGQVAPPMQALPPVGSTGQRLKVVKLEPEVRVIDLEKAIPTIPMDAIRQFLDKSMVVDKEKLDKAPYVLDIADEHMAAGSGYRIYVRGIKDAEPSTYTVVHPDKEYRDPDTGERLGYEALYLATADIQRMGDPATLELKKAQREVLVGDRLLPGGPDSFNQNFMPHAPANQVKGKIISAFDAITQFADHQVVVLNLGKREGMEQGDVLAIYKEGIKVKDVVKGGTVKLPDERAGLLMVFRTFDKVSYALVMRATRAIRVNDMVQNP